MITPKTKQRLMELQERGKKIVLASGRPTPGVLPLARELELAKYGSYILSFNGGRITFECVCKPDLVAPGNHVLACAPGADNGYGVKSGTSMSTPLVAGAAALMLEKNPELTNVQIKMKLKESARDMGLPKNQQGWGELDLERFMEL